MAIRIVAPTDVPAELRESRRGGRQARRPAHKIGNTSLTFMARAAGLLLALLATNARAEIAEITVAQQYGVSFLPLMMMMEKNALIEKHAAQGGLAGLKVSWVKLSGPSSMNDALISNALHLAAQGAPSMITLWDKTHGQIKGVAAMTTYPLYLISRNPAVKTIKDFTANDKIAIPSVKISTTPWKAASTRRSISIRTASRGAT